MQQRNTLSVVSEAPNYYTAAAFGSVSFILTLASIVKDIDAFSICLGCTVGSAAVYTAQRGPEATMADAKMLFNASKNGVMSAKNFAMSFFPKKDTSHTNPVTVIDAEHTVDESSDSKFKMS